MKILVIEDEAALSDSIITYLRQQGYTCEWAHDYATAIQKTESFEYACILLDISLPGGNGLSILNNLKANRQNCGVIILSARNSIDDRVAGLNLGADDYLPKPFHLSELNARLAAVLRRRMFDGNQKIEVDELTIDTLAREVQVHGKPLDFTPKEFLLLLHLVSNRNRVVSKNAIAENLTEGVADAFDNFDFIYSHIKNIKRKIAQAGGKDRIKSMYGLGYKLEI
jgi:DNA-binding response OmpR family regulator